MQGEDYYTALNFDVKKRPRPGASQDMKEAKPQVPHWYRPAFRISGVLNVVLLLTVIALRIFGFLCNQDDAHTRCRKPLGNSSVPGCGTWQIDSSPSHSAAPLCPCLPGSGSGAQPCPMDWLWHKGKCYYFSRDTGRSWSRSREDCAKRDSQLLVIQDQEEKDFIHHQAGDRYHWIGLHISSPGRSWTWVDGSPISEKLVSVSESMGQDRCMALGYGRFYSDSCNRLFEWICQKEAGKE
ncbi:killer cell lectin-like receptor subfamily F member 1 isoform X2 [Rhinatrema bivittatum]|uniref:killer cell lectin-like receptor subfamily F member 1 isoform X2 n=1 Tax=Rhinatrema bivittatum TaxID=194408 RepID=UPI0011263C57|nr:killer cell lectin-like receptor subfamily F member 1 isoform X2 [Rhinatrema bivittatum]